MLLMKNMELIGKFILIASQIRTKECLPAYLVSITQRISWRLIMMGSCLNRCGNRRANCGIMRHWGHSLYSSTGQQFNFSLFDVDWIVNKISLSSMGLVLKQKQSWVIPYIHR